MKKVCETCKWYETYTGACCNGDSDYCADYVSSMNSCENWEGGTMTARRLIVKLSAKINKAIIGNIYDNPEMMEARK